MIVRPGSTPNSRAAQFESFRARELEILGAAAGTCGAISRENPRNLGKIRPPVLASHRTAWDPVTMARHRKPAGIASSKVIPASARSRTRWPDAAAPCPDDLSDAQKRWWQAVVRSVPEGILTRADNQVLERMAIAGRFIARPRALFAKAQFW